MNKSKIQHKLNLIISAQSSQQDTDILEKLSDTVHNLFNNKSL